MRTTKRKNLRLMKRKNLQLMKRKRYLNLLQSLRVSLPEKSFLKSVILSGK